MHCLPYTAESRLPLGEQVTLFQREETTLDFDEIDEPQAASFPVVA